MDPRALVAERLDQLGLDVHVDVFQLGGEREVAAFDAFEDRIQLFPDRPGGFHGDDSGRAEHCRMSLAAHDVVLVQTAVVRDGFREILHVFSGVF